MNPKRKRARTSIDNLLTTLKEQLAQPGQSCCRCSTSMSRFPKYSLANQMLIFAQRPDATCVMGYRAWNKAGYQVRKGENGIAIYAPMLFASKRDTARGVRQRRPPHPVSATASPTSSTSPRWTRSPAPTQRQSRQHPPTPAPTATSRRSRPSSSATTSSSSTRQLAPGLLGYTDGRRITCGTGQASHVEFATLAHETTHVLLHFDRNAEGYVAMHDDMNGDNDHRWITRLFQLVTAG